MGRKIILRSSAIFHLCVVILHTENIILSDSKNFYAKKHKSIQIPHYPPHSPYIMYVDGGT